MKKIVLGVLLALALVVPAQGQQIIDKVHSDSYFGCSQFALVATLTECAPAPTNVSERYYITDIIVQTTTATSGTYNIQSGTGVNCATATTAVFPDANVANKWNAPVAGSIDRIHLNTPIRVTRGHAICVLGVAANTINIYIRGIRTLL